MPPTLIVSPLWCATRFHTLLAVCQLLLPNCPAEPTVYAYSFSPYLASFKLLSQDSFHLWQITDHHSAISYDSGVTRVNAFYCESFFCWTLLFLSWKRHINKMFQACWLSITHSYTSGKIKHLQKIFHKTESNLLMGYGCHCTLCTKENPGKSPISSLIMTP